MHERVSSAIYGSASILPIVWMYIRMMGDDGLRKASEVAILSANWLSKKIDPYFKVLYKGKNGRVAHECIFDIRNYPGITAEDVAKRLMDYGFHAPTMSWPVSGTVMVEPTESESLEELERFGEAMNLIRCEIDENPELLKNAPHTARMIADDEWSYPYTRDQAAYPVDQEDKFWVAVGRVDNAYGDRNLVCSCSDYFSESYK
jgi:glycine dehydrogenase